MSVIINGTSGISTDGGSELFGSGSIGGSLTLTSGTANGVTYLNGSKVLTSGSALTFDGTANLTIGNSNAALVSTGNLYLDATGGGGVHLRVAGYSPSVKVLSTSEPVFSVNNSEAMRLTSTGLGIGTSSPAKKLEISGSTGVAARITQTTSASDTYSQLEFYDSALSSTQAYIRTLRQGATGQSSIAFATKDSSTLAERVRITSTGNVGIGTSSPSQKLVVYDSGTVYSMVETANSGAYAIFEAKNPTNSLLVWNRGDNSRSYLTSTAWDLYVGTDAAKFVGFYTNGTERLRIDSSGNVGIGTSSPDANHRLEVATGGTAEVGIRSGNTNEAILNFGRTSDRLRGRIAYNNSSEYMAFWANQGEKARIDSSGNLLVGTTSAANPNTQKMVIKYQSTVGTVNSHLALVGDSATNGQGPQILFSESGDGQNFAGGTIGFVRTGSNSIGDLVFGTRGSAGDSTTVATERMRIDSAGRVTMPYQPAFMAMRTSTDINTSQTMVFNSAVLNVGNGYNTSNGKYTAPVAGVYEFSFFALHRYRTGNGYVDVVPYKNGAAFLPGNQRIAYSQINQAQEQVVGGVFMVSLAANDTIEISLNFSSSNTDIYGGDINSFCGKLIG